MAFKTGIKKVLKIVGIIWAVICFIGSIALFSISNIVGGIVFVILGALGIIPLIVGHTKNERCNKNIASVNNETLIINMQKQFETIGLPNLSTDSIILKNGEICHFESVASFCKLKTQTVGMTGGSRGVSFRLMKGVSIRTGNFRASPIRKEIIESTNGKIFLTSEKIVFSAPKNAVTFKYKKIVAIDIYKTLVQIQTDDKNYLFDMNDKMEFLVILDFLLKKNSENSELPVNNKSSSEITIDSISSLSKADEIHKLLKLKQDGVLTQEEFDTEKSKLLKA